MTKHLRGVLAPVVSTFSGDGDELAVKAFVGNLRGHLAAGLDGIVVAGSTGEAVLLDESERHQLIESAREVVPREKWLIVGVGAESTKLTERRIRDAAARGADAVLVVSPHYYTASMTEEALRAHFERIAERSTLPVILYNIPKYTHFALTPALVQTLSRHQNIIGIKDSSGDLSVIGGYLQSQSADFTVLTGSGSTFGQALALGARGGILAVALFAGHLSCDVFRRHQDGDQRGAEAEQRRLTPLAAEIVNGLGVAGVKAALDLVGLSGGAVRSPLRALGERERARVAETLRAAEQSAAA